MPEERPPDLDQKQNISNSSIEESQVQFSQASGNSIQVQGNNNQLFLSQAKDNLILEKQTLARQEYRNRQVLLRKVKNYWIKGVLEKSLYQRARIDLELEERFDAIDLAWATPERSRRPLPEGTKVIDKFSELGNGCTLLILGEPGSGKTTQLLEIARDLIDQAEQDISLTIPVVFNLSSWTNIETLSDWIVQELETKYQVPKALAYFLIKSQQLILLLDGLDEVKTKYRRKCIVAINQFNQKYRQTRIVVCSRTEDYEHLPTRLSFQSAILIKQLTFEKLNNYLEQSGSKFVGIKLAIQKNPRLQEIFRSPLMLSLAVSVYQEISSPEILKLDYKERLFDFYIRQMLVDQRFSQVYDRRKAISWLTWLAKRMEQESISVLLIEEIQPSWLEKRVEKRSYQIGNFLLINGVLGGLTFNLLKGLEWATDLILYGDLSYRDIFWLSLHNLNSMGFSQLNQQSIAMNVSDISAKFIAIFILLIFGMLAALLGASKKRIKPIKKLTWSWGNAWNSFMLMLFVGNLLTFLGWLTGTLVGSYIPGLNFETASGHDLHTILSSGFGTAFGQTVGYLGGFISGLTFGVKHIESETTVPNQGIWNSAKNFVQTFVFITIICGLLIYWGFTSIYWELPNGLFIALMLGLSLGLTFALVSSGIICIRHFVLRFLLFTVGYTPWNYTRFLNWATDRLFLRKVGGGYTFTHRLLMEHFAQLKDK